MGVIITAISRSSVDAVATQRRRAAGAGVRSAGRSSVWTTDRSSAASRTAAPASPVGRADRSLGTATRWRGGSRRSIHGVALGSSFSAEPGVLLDELEVPPPLAQTPGVAGQGDGGDDQEQGLVPVGVDDRVGGA